MSQIELEKPDQLDIKPITKYSIVPKFWTSPTEIAADEFVASYDATGKVYINFIDSDGRLWKGHIDDFVVIKNLPNKEDIEDFVRMKKESEEMSLEIKRKNKLKENEKQTHDVY